MTVPTNLNYFNSGSIYPGSNQVALQRIEAWMDLVKHTSHKVIIPSLGLFGPASTGKTTISNEIAGILSLPVFSINGNSLSSSIDVTNFLNNSSMAWINENRFAEPSIFFIDECHSVSKKVQTEFLSFLESRIWNFSHYDTNFSRCLFIFATTDSSKLLQPLVTRFYSVTLNQYSTEDVSNIVRRHLPNVDTEASLLTAKIAKNIPREALTHTRIALSKTENDRLTKTDVISYLTSIGLGEEGLDSTDYQILNFLKNSNKNTSNDPKHREFLYNKEIINELNKETTLNLSKTLKKKKAEIVVTAFQLRNESDIEYQPRSRQDISLGCRLYDMRDLEIRLSYLEFLNKLEKTSRGIRYVE